MEKYLQVFINSKQNDWVMLLPMTEFGNNNTKNIYTGHTFFELSYGNHPCILFKDDVNPCSRSCSAKKIAQELRDLILICQQNLLHVQEL